MGTPEQERGGFLWCERRSVTAAGRQLAGLVALLCAALAAGCAYPSKLAYERQMEELCLRDGGLTVFRHVQLPSVYFHADGGLLYVPGAPQQVIAGKYVIKKWVETLQVNPGVRLALEKHVSTATEQASGELLGRYVVYYRKGGDSISPNNTSSQCPLNSKQFIHNVFSRSAP